MAEYIEREKAFECLKIARGYCPCAYEEITHLKAAEVATVRHEQWINAYIRGQHHYRCSGCGAYTEATWHSNFVYNYCPNCGAKMDLEG